MMNDQNFDQFANDVLAKASEILAANNTLPDGQLFFNNNRAWKCYSKSWKCIYAFEDGEVYYRLGKTTPRKGLHRGKELLVIELVMDGHKKQAFLPLLAQKNQIENKLGTTLEREQPKIEATGKYRFKLFLPYFLVKEGNIRTAAEKLAGLIATTKPVLNKSGVV